MGKGKRRPCATRWRTLTHSTHYTLVECDPLTGRTQQKLPAVKIYANSHYVTPRPTLNQATKAIKAELRERLDELTKAGRLLEAQRLEQRTRFDLEMIKELGYCQGVENYSRYLSGRAPGEPPGTLIDYFPEDYLLFIDESHIKHAVSFIEHK